MFFDTINIKENSVIEARFVDDKKEYIRCTFTPDMDIDTIEYPEVKEKAKELWTSEVINSYKKSLEDFEI